MAVRTLRRKVLIREYDFAKVKSQAFATVGINSLYDRASFNPVSLDGIEKERIIDILKGKPEPVWSDLDMPNIALYNIKDRLYNEKYYDWMVTFDEEGYLWVQSRRNTPKSRIGWGIFEKDLISRV